jgi:hypothetical protein
LARLGERIWALIGNVDPKQLHGRRPVIVLAQLFG